MSTQSKPKKQNFFQDSIESGGGEMGQQVSNLSKDTIRAMWEDFFKASAKQTLPEQLLSNKSESTTNSPKEAVLQEGQEFSLIPEKSNEKTKVNAEHREYFRSLDSVEKPRHEEAENQQHIDALQSEIKKLIKASREMEMAFKQVSHQVTVENRTENASKYQVNFLEWILITVRNARVRVEEGKNWLALFTSKKGQQKYWNQFSKKGTSFSLSSERNVATQTG